MNKNDQILTGMLVGALLVAGLTYMYAHRAPSSAGQNDGGIDVEAQIGARTMPYFARGGHYGLLDSVPLEWERHRLVYPRRPCANLESLLKGDLSLDRPAYDPADRYWFSDPPTESML